RDLCSVGYTIRNDLATAGDLSGCASIARSRLTLSAAAVAHIGCRAQVAVLARCVGGHEVILRTVVVDPVAELLDVARSASRSTYRRALKIGRTIHSTAGAVFCHIAAPRRRLATHRATRFEAVGWAVGA